MLPHADVNDYETRMQRWQCRPNSFECYSPQRNRPPI